jgi:hypothetical protein
MVTHGIAPEVTAEPAVRSVRHFARHLGEMVIAMVVGMMVLGALDRGILAAAGTSVSAVRDSAPEVVALMMAFNMTVGMTVWMRLRGHSWARVADMAAAMFVPAVGAIVLFWCAVIPSGSIFAVEHAAMLPAMIAVMLLHRDEYSRPAHVHLTTARTAGSRDSLRPGTPPAHAVSTSSRASRLAPVLPPVSASGSISEMRGSAWGAETRRGGD